MADHSSTKRRALYHTNVLQQNLWRLRNKAAAEGDRIALTVALVKAQEFEDWMVANFPDKSRSGTDMKPFSAYGLGMDNPPDFPSLPAALVEDTP